jgi:hypothetical protein
MMVRPPLPPPHAVPVVTPLPAYQRAAFNTNPPLLLLPPPEPLPLFREVNTLTFEERLAKRLGPKVRRRSWLVGAMVDAVGLQVVILTLTLAILLLR